MKSISIGSGRSLLFAGLIIAAFLAAYVAYLIKMTAGLSGIDANSQRAILATISQALATVLAIVFSLALVAGQLASRYSPRLFSRVLRFWTFAYMALFILTIAMSLAWLYLAEANQATLGPFDFGIRWLSIAALSLSFLCLALLIPYLMHLRDMLLPETLFRELVDESLSEFRRTGDFPHSVSTPSQPVADVPESVSAIYDVTLSSTVARDHMTFEMGVLALKQLLLKAPVPPGWTEDRELPGERVVARLRTLGLVLVTDPVASRSVVDRLGEGGLGILETADRRHARPVLRAIIISLGLIGRASAERQGWEEVARQAAYQLGQIAWRAADADVDEAQGEDLITNKAARELGSLGVATLERSWMDATRQTVNGLASAGERMKKKQLDGPANTAVHELGTIKRVALEKLEQAVSVEDRKDLEKVARNVSYAIQRISDI